METTVTTKNRVTIPQAIARKLGIRPGWRLDWHEATRADEIVVRIIPDRAELGRRLFGKGSQLSPKRNAVADLEREREAEL